MFSAKPLRGAVAPLALFAALYGGTVSWAQSPRRPNPNSSDTKPAFDPQAAASLRRMVKAERTIAYIAREGTFRTDAPGEEHLVKADPTRGIRRESLTGSDAGQVIVQLLQRGDRLPKGAADRVAETIRRLAKGVLSAQVVGQDRVAGRVCDIVAVRATRIPDAPTRRFWIDRETGLRLRTEEKSANGKLLSGSYYTSLDLSPTFAPNDFTPTLSQTPSRYPGKMRQEIGERRRFKTMDEARRAGFATAAPVYVPEGYSLRVVEATASGDHIALRYANGMNALSLTSLKGGVPPRVRPFLRSDGSAFVPFPQGKSGLFVRSETGAVYLLIGDLSEAELRKVAASIR